MLLKILIGVVSYAVIGIVVDILSRAYYTWFEGDPLWSKPDLGDAFVAVLWPIWGLWVVCAITYRLFEKLIIIIESEIFWRDD